MQTFLSAQPNHASVCNCCVYIHPWANANVAMSRLFCCLLMLSCKHPEGFFIVAVDFNHINLKTVLPRFYKTVDLKTRKGRTVDQVYTNISLFLTPAYKPLICRSKPQYKPVECWTEEATLSLQDYFEDTIGAL